MPDATWVKKGHVTEFNKNLIGKKIGGGGKWIVEQKITAIFALGRQGN
jgi:hypothetical protein